MTKNSTCTITVRRTKPSRRARLPVDRAHRTEFTAHGRVVIDGNVLAEVFATGSTEELATGVAVRQLAAAL